MKSWRGQRIRGTVGQFCIAAVAAFSLVLPSCNPSGLGGGNDNSAPPTSTPDPDSGGGNSSGDSGSDGVDSVGDVMVPPSGDPPAGQDTPFSLLRMRIRNETTARADVTVRYIRDDVIVHLAFVRAQPVTVTTVTSAEMPSRIEVSGVDEFGAALRESRLAFGVDFDEIKPAEYVIAAQAQPNPGEEPPPQTLPASIRMIEPSDDVEVRIGDTFVARWEDEGGAAGTVVSVFLRRIAPVASSELIPAGPAVTAALDGLNDQLVVVLQGISPGTYEVVARIHDGARENASTAPGRIQAVEDPENEAPTLTIRSPASLQVITQGGVVPVEWSDADPDDNATITFALESVDAAGLATGSFAISPPLAEDPDGAAHDRAVLSLGGVLPGVYDLVGTIDDGDLRGIARVRNTVQIIPPPSAPVNDPPTLRLLAPETDTIVLVGGSFTIRWEDSDANDDARISLMLDPDLEAIDVSGNEILLAASLGEDLDDTGDQITIGVPADTPPGAYRLVGTITDGAAQVITRAPGLLTVEVPDPTDSDPIPLRLIRFGSPLDSIRTRLGQTIPIRIDYQNVSTDVPVRLYLTGTTATDFLRVDITPAGFGPNRDIEVLLPATGATVPNGWWPRKFTLRAEANDGSARYAAEAPVSIWIRQEVEIIHAGMVNYFCWDEAKAEYDNSDFFGLEIEWYGGGFTDRDDPGSVSGADGEQRARVQFWVSNEGLVPNDIKGDRGHRMVFETIESPNAIKTARIDYATVLNLDPNAPPNMPPTELLPAIDSNYYRVVAAARTQAFGRLVTSAENEPVEICFPLPAFRKPPTP